MLLNTGLNSEMKSEMKSEIKNTDGIIYLETLREKSIDLVLTDPPYITSRTTGMDKQKKVVERHKLTKENIKTEEDSLHQVNDSH